MDSWRGMGPGSSPGHRRPCSSCLPLSTPDSLPIPRTRRREPLRSGVHVEREAEVLLSLTCKRWNAGEGFKPSPTAREPKAGHGAFAATSHKPRAILPSPSPCTTHHVPRTTTNTRVRPRGGINESRSITTGHKPRATCRCFVVPAARAFGSREPVQTGAVSVTRTCRKKQW